MKSKKFQIIDFEDCPHCGGALCVYTDDFCIEDGADVICSEDYCLFAGGIILYLDRCEVIEIFDNHNADFAYYDSQKNFKKAIRLFLKILFKKRYDGTRIGIVAALRAVRKWLK